VIPWIIYGPEVGVVKQGVNKDVNKSTKKISVIFFFRNLYVITDNCFNG